MGISRECSLYYDSNTANYLIEYRGDFKERIDKIPYACGDIITETIGVISVKVEDLDRLLNDVPEIVFFDFRVMYVLQDVPPNLADNINDIKVSPYLDLNGKGVLIGLVDTGIDYLNEEFIREDGTSKVISIWDQSIPNNTDKSVYMGTIYSNKEINDAIIASKNNKVPYEIVPSKDEVGHGTKIAGIIGAKGYNKKFQGIAQESDFVVVKLFESSNFHKELEENGLNDIPVYNASEIVAGLEYLIRVSKELKRPMVIYIGIGSTEGSHDGTNLISRYVTDISSNRGVCIVAGGGNEGDSQGHTMGYIKSSKDVKEVNLIIPKELRHFHMFIWVRRPNIASLKVISPTGESSPIIEVRSKIFQPFKFIYLNTDMIVRYYSPEHFTGHEVINVVFNNIKPGIWRFNLIGNYIVDGRYDIWLQPIETLPPNTNLLESNPYNTVTMPASAINVITVGYYGTNNSYIAASSKGFNVDNIVNPDVVTIGVNILTTKVSGGITTFSGSSAATAIVAGTCALLLQWGIINKNDETMYSKKITSYLKYGAKRNQSSKYPNQEVGYGELNLLETFNILAGIYRGEKIEQYGNSFDKIRIHKYYEFNEYYINNLFIRIPKERKRI